jgi:gas vesicle protein
LGWLFADSFSSFFRSSGNTEEAQPHEIQKVIDACVKAEADTRRGLAEVMKRIGSEIQRSLTEVRQNVLRDSQSELKHIENLLKNEALKTRALQDISSYRVELSKITGRQINV